MSNQYMERFFKKHHENDPRKNILRQHPAFLLATQELSVRTSVVDTLRRMRKERRLTQKQLADRAGLSRTYIARLESGKETNPGLQSLERLVNVLGGRIVIIHES